MVKFLPIIFGFLILGLFAIALISGGIRLAAVNNAPQSIGDDAALQSYAGSLNSSLGQAYTAANDAEKAINQSAITLTTGFPALDAVFGIWKTIKTVPITIYNLTIGLLFGRLLGSDSYAIVLGVLSSILIIGIIYAVYKVITTGEGG
jgi:hypothetical protein